MRFTLQTVAYSPLNGKTVSKEGFLNYWGKIQNAARKLEDIETLQKMEHDVKITKEFETDVEVMASAFCKNIYFSEK